MKNRNGSLYVIAIILLAAVGLLAASLGKTALGVLGVQYNKGLHGIAVTEAENAMSAAVHLLNTLPPDGKGVDWRPVSETVE